MKINVPFRVKYEFILNLMAATQLKERWETATKVWKNESSSQETAGGTLCN